MSVDDVSEVVFLRTSLGRRLRHTPAMSSTNLLEAQDCDGANDLYSAPSLDIDPSFLVYIVIESDRRVSLIISHLSYRPSPHFLCLVVFPEITLSDTMFCTRELSRLVKIVVSRVCFSVSRSVLLFLFIQSELSTVFRRSKL